MIDLGISQLGLIAIVALVVIGPEKLPTVARTLGTWIGRARHYVHSVKTEMAQVTELDALREIKNSAEQAAWQAEKETHKLLHDAQLASDIEAIEDSLHAEAHCISPRPYTDTSVERKNWRLKRHAMPYWYRARHNAHTRTLSSAIRVVRQRPIKPR